MPSHIIKPKRDEDRYIGWSTVVDNGWSIGTREEAIAYYAEDRLDRADESGTSALWPNLVLPAFGWDEKRFYIHNDDAIKRSKDAHAYVDREDLWEYVTLADDDPTRIALIHYEPIKED